MISVLYLNQCKLGCKSSLVSFSKAIVGGKWNCSQWWVFVYFSHLGIFCEKFCLKTCIFNFKNARPKLKGPWILYEDFFAQNTLKTKTIATFICECFCPWEKYIIFELSCCTHPKKNSYRFFHKNWTTKTTKILQILPPVKYNMSYLLMLPWRLSKCSHSRDLCCESAGFCPFCEVISLRNQNVTAESTLQIGCLATFHFSQKNW